LREPASFPASLLRLDQASRSAFCFLLSIPILLCSLLSIPPFYLYSPPPLASRLLCPSHLRPARSRVRYPRLARICMPPTLRLVFSSCVDPDPVSFRVCIPPPNQHITINLDSWTLYIPQPSYSILDSAYRLRLIVIAMILLACAYAYAGFSIPGRCRRCLCRFPTSTDHDPRFLLPPPPTTPPLAPSTHHPPPRCDSAPATNT
jgi:hypothetical protein